MGRRKSAREGQAQEEHADTAGISTLMLLLKKMVSIQGAGQLLANIDAAEPLTAA
jgi:hypothetical protein